MSNRVSDGCDVITNDEWTQGKDDDLDGDEGKQTAKQERSAGTVGGGNAGADLAGRRCRAIERRSRGGQVLNPTLVVPASRTSFEVPAEPPRVDAPVLAVLDRREGVHPPCTVHIGMVARA